LKVVLLEHPPYGPWAIEAETVERLGGSLAIVDYAAFAAHPCPADVILNVCAGPLPPALLDAVGCRCVVGYGIGTDFVDLGEATRRGIAVANMPLANVEEVATHTLALLLACARRLLELDQVVRSGGFDWPRTAPIHRLHGRRLGLVAFGNIARRVAALVQPLGLDVAAHDPYVPAETMAAAGVQPLEADELLSSADLVSVHLPASPETHRFLDDRRLSLLRTGAIVVITSRGDVYDAHALEQRLRDRRIGAAGLDVFPEEPLPVNHPLTRLSNVILTPHVAGYAEESIAGLHQAAAAILETVAAGQVPPGALNASVTPRRSHS
jgi:D-3-phosphoglycerate dehydrogenase